MSATDFNSGHESQRLAANFRSMLNDLKRRPEDAARDLDVKVEVILAVLAGDAPLSKELVARALEVWPVSERDFFLLRDDAPQGVKIMRAHESAASSRIMNRGGQAYYEYRDTAMSSSAAFRPEWIRQLCVVDDNDPDNTSALWNNGHLLHQFTYFAGPVNFYYKNEQGKKQVAVMNSGDSMYIAPYVPHTFTTRRNSDNVKGLILALTYGNKLYGDSQQELSLLQPDQAEALTLDFETPQRATGELVRFHRESLSMPRLELARAIGGTTVQIEEIENGHTALSPALLASIAGALHVDERDLLATGAGSETVQILPASEARSWPVLSAVGTAVYDVVELCAAPRLPFSKALRLHVRAGSESDVVYLKAGLHQYVYNMGSIPAAMSWKDGNVKRHDVLQVDDSVYIKPGVSHSFCAEGAELLVLRIGGRIGGDALHELSGIGRDYLPRLLSENVQWFDAKGRKS